MFKAFFARLGKAIKETNPFANVIDNTEYPLAKLRRSSPLDMLVDTYRVFAGKSKYEELNKTEKGKEDVVEYSNDWNHEASLDKK